MSTSQDPDTVQNTANFDETFSNKPSSRTIHNAESAPQAKDVIHDIETTKDSKGSSNFLVKKNSLPSNDLPIKVLPVELSSKTPENNIATKEIDNNGNFGNVPEDSKPVVAIPPGTQTDNPIKEEKGKPTSQPAIASPKLDGREDEYNHQKSKQLTFKSKRISWYNPLHGQMMDSRILIQNVNGPCALIAVVNTLVLNYQLDHNYQSGLTEKHSKTPEDSRCEELIRLIESREEINDTDIVGVLGDMLLSANAAASIGSSSEPIDDGTFTAVLNLLPHLHEGLNINPNFLTGGIDNSQQDVQFNIHELDESFTKEISLSVVSDAEGKKSINVNDSKSSPLNPEVALFKAFGIDIFHSWMIDPITNVEEYKIINYLQNFDNCQNFLIFAEDLISHSKDSPDPPDEGLLSNGCPDVSSSHLTPAKKLILQSYADQIRSWLNSHPTQLTPSGLSHLVSAAPGSRFSIFFRNDHFSTLLKRAVVDETGQPGAELYCLVTDEGLRGYRDVVWQEVPTGGNTFTAAFLGKREKQAVEENGVMQDLANYGILSLELGEERFYDGNFIPVDLSQEYERQTRHNTRNNTAVQRATSGSDFIMVGGEITSALNVSEDHAPVLQNAGNTITDADYLASSYFDGQALDSLADYRLAQSLQAQEDAYIASRIQRKYQVKNQKLKNTGTKRVSNSTGAVSPAGKSGVHKKKLGKSSGPKLIDSKSKKEGCVIM